MPCTPLFTSGPVDRSTDEQEQNTIDTIQRLGDKPPRPPKLNEYSKYRLDNSTAGKLTGQHKCKRVVTRTIWQTPKHYGTSNH